MSVIPDLSDLGGEQGGGSAFLTITGDNIRLQNLMPANPSNFEVCLTPRIVGDRLHMELEFACGPDLVSKNVEQDLHEFGGPVEIEYLFAGLPRQQFALLDLMQYADKPEMFKDFLFGELVKTMTAQGTDMTVTVVRSGNLLDINLEFVRMDVSVFQLRFEMALSDAEQVLRPKSHA